MKLEKHILLNHEGVKAEFARSEKVEPQRISRWVKNNYIVIDGVMYKPMRILNK